MNKIRSSYNVLALVATLGIMTASVTWATTMTLTDTEITSRLYHQLSQEKGLSSLKIQPLVEHGQVSLKGSVSSIYQAIALIELTEKMQGVKAIDTSHLILKATRKPIRVTDDLYLNSKIKNLYERKKVFGPYELDALGITIDTIQGNVVLSGAIHQKRTHVTPEEYHAQVKTAIKLAKGLRGVHSIDTERLVLIIQYADV